MRRKILALFLALPLGGCGLLDPVDRVADELAQHRAQLELVNGLLVNVVEQLRQLLRQLPAPATVR